MANPYLSKITVLNVHPVSKGNIKAFATVQLGETLTIQGIKIVQQAGQKAYVRLPENERDGKYYPVVSAIDKRFQGAVQEKVLGAWQDGGGR